MPIYKSRIAHFAIDSQNDAVRLSRSGWDILSVLKYLARHSLDGWACVEVEAIAVAAACSKATAKRQIDKAVLIGLLQRELRRDWTHGRPARYRYRYVSDLPLMQEFSQSVKEKGGAA